MKQLISVCCALPFLTGTAWGWGCTAHPMVALIARAHLSPAVSQAVDKLLSDNPLDPAARRYCQEHYPDSMADIASWADDRKGPDKTAVWHYVDIPLAVSRQDSEKGAAETGALKDWCEEIGPSVDGKDRPGCVTTAIRYEMAILKDTSKTGSERANALRYLVHLLGDLGQPLHSEDNHDQGGNCTQITFFGGERPDNLHSIWDEKLVARDVQKRAITGTEYAAQLDKEFSGNWSQWGEGKFDVEGWAWEAHELARSVTYGKLSPAIPVEPAAAGQTDRNGCTLERAKIADLHISIGDEYFNDTMPTIRQQLAKAGYRLALVLNQSF